MSTMRYIVAVAALVAISLGGHSSPTFASNYGLWWFETDAQLDGYTKELNKGIRNLIKWRNDACSRWIKDAQREAVCTEAHNVIIHRRELEKACVMLVKQAKRMNPKDTDKPFFIEQMCPKDVFSRENKITGELYKLVKGQFRPRDDSGE